MKLARLILALLAVAAAAFLAFNGCRGSAANAPALPPAPTPATDADIQKWFPDGSPTAPANAAKPAPIPDVPDEPPFGAPVAPGAEVALEVPYRAGTKSRYRVAEAESDQDVESGLAHWARFIWSVSTEVEKVEDNGDARIRLQIDSFLYQTSGPGQRVEFNSAEPDNSILDDPYLGLAPTLRPYMAIAGMPVQFVVDRAGVIRAVKGVDALYRKFVDAADVLGAQVRKDIEPTAPTSESLIEKWGEILFPPIGGGKLKASQGREMEFATTYLERWAIASPGTLRVTHDDADVFRVEFKGKPVARELSRPAVGALARAVEKIFVESDADAHAASYRFDRKAGRLTFSRVHAKYRLWVSIRIGAAGNNTENFEKHFTDVEVEKTVELLDK